MAKQKTVRLKHQELNTLKELCKDKHPKLANKIKGYMNVKAA